MTFFLYPILTKLIIRHTVDISRSCTTSVFNMDVCIVSAAEHVFVHS